jgi:hypothetical protein
LNESGSAKNLNLPQPQPSALVRQLS